MMSEIEKLHSVTVEIRHTFHCNWTSDWETWTGTVREAEDHMVASHSNIGEIRVDGIVISTMIKRIGSRHIERGFLRADGSFRQFDVYARSEHA